MAVRERIHPLSGEPIGHNGHSRPDAFTMRMPRREVRASYDAARNSDEFKNYWANADALDADSANNKGVRQRLVTRSRYEVGNNGFMDGMVQTHANYVVGTGPSLRMQTGTPGFNQAVENSFGRWAKAILLRRKLWAMAHAKVQDGEAVGLARENPKINHRVQLDLTLIETEQMQTPYLPTFTVGYVDGIKFDDFGNPIWYDILPYHPGGPFAGFMTLLPDQIPAKFVLHWFQLRRPGQHRGVPEFRSTLNVGAASRRFREATVAAAETAADIGAMLTSTLSPSGDSEPDPVAPFTSIEFTKRMLMTAPMGWDAKQMKGEHPNAQYEAFVDLQINETGRPKHIPKNIAKGDSSGYNYASGRLDHQSYFSSIDVEREDANDLVLDPLFALWWEEAVPAYGWNADPRNPPAHLWDWPKHPVADIVSEADAADRRLKNGSTYPTQVYSEEGRDFEDELPHMAADYGVSEDEMRKILLHATFNAQNQQASMQSADSQALIARANAKRMSQPPKPVAPPAEVDTANA
jgi:capsid protein